MFNQEQIRKNCGNLEGIQGTREQGSSLPWEILITSLAMYTYVLNSKSLGRVSTKSESE